MTNCYNCGHTGTFVLLVQFALAVPGPDAEGCRPDRTDADEASDDGGADSDRGQADPDEISDSGGLSLAVQCPACDSTDVGVAVEDLLARYRSSTTS